MPTSPESGSPNAALAELVAGGQEEKVVGAAARPTSPYLLFRAGTRWIGVRPGSVREVVPKTYVTRLPSAPPQVVGITLLRGRIVPVVSLEELLGAEGVGELVASLPRLVVLQEGETEVAVVADETRGILELEVPDPTADVAHRFILGEATWEDHLVCIIDATTFVGMATGDEGPAPG